MRMRGIALLLVALGGFAGCGGDDSDKSSEKGSPKCGDVASANSGRGATDLELTGIACADAQAVLSNPTGLASYDCKSVEKTSSGERFSCTDGSKKIAFTTSSD